VFVTKRTTTSEYGVAQLLKMSPVAAVLTGKMPTLPPVEAPDLQGLAIKVPAPQDLTVGDLELRFYEKARALATKRERAKGEALKMGDDAKLDVLGYVGGKLIPFSARFGFWLELTPMPALPGFAEAVAAAKVGDAVHVQLNLPADYPIEALRNKPARFLIDVRQAREVKMPDTESKEFLGKLGLGATLEEAMDKIREELEQEMADQLWADAERMVLEAVAERTKVEVPKSLIDDEIRRRWTEAEGRAMVEKNFSVDEQNEALTNWLTDSLTRTDCEQRLRISLGLKAIAERDKLTLTPERFESMIAGYAKPFGFSAEEVKKSLRQSEDLTRRMHDVAWHLLAVEHVVDQTKVTFEGAAQPS
jgi:trigger factor